jgi:adenylylsulfate kinase-like enzyme
MNMAIVPPQSAGQLIWITGLAGAGKTTLSKHVYAKLKASKPELVLLDGDQLRQVFGGKQGYSQDDRLALAMSYCRLCKVLCDQGIDVICATISLFSECHRWNRENISRYFEVYVQTPMAVLLERDQKQLYSKALRGEIQHVVGVDLEFVPPEQPDLIINNSGSLDQMEGFAETICTALQIQV